MSVARVPHTLRHKVPGLLQSQNWGGTHGRCELEDSDKVVQPETVVCDLEQPLHCIAPLPGVVM